MHGGSSLPPSVPHFSLARDILQLLSSAHEVRSPTDEGRATSVEGDDNEEAARAEGRQRAERATMSG